MAGERVECLCSELREEEKRLRAELADARKRVKTLEAEARRVKTSISALSGKSAGARKRSRGKQGSSGSSLESRMVELAADVIRRAGSMPEDRLEEEIASRLGTECPSREMLAAMLRSALEDRRFTPSVSGWRLSEHTVKQRTREPASVEQLA